ncbi:MAG: hypothetical protein J6W43_00890 [Prevotella sp.]|nr:hypothetical protein [Prevotella sp.]
MKKILLWMLPFLMGSVCHAEDITIRYKGATAKVSQQIKDSVKVTVNVKTKGYEKTFTLSEQFTTVR